MLLENRLEMEEIGTCRSVGEKSSGRCHQDTSDALWMSAGVLVPKKASHCGEVPLQQVLEGPHTPTRSRKCREIPELWTRIVFNHDADLRKLQMRRHKTPNFCLTDNLRLDLIRAVHIWSLFSQTVKRTLPRRLRSAFNFYRKMHSDNIQEGK